MQVTDDVLLCWRSNSKDCTGEVVGPLFNWEDLNGIANMINKRGINCSYEFILTIGSYVTSTHPTHGHEEKTYFKMAQTLMMKELDVYIAENTVWISNYMIWLGKYNLP